MNSNEDPVRARQCSRAFVTAVVLGALAVLLYAISIVKLVLA